MDVARSDWTTGRLAHCIFPAWEAGEYVSPSREGSIALAFSAQHAATVEIGGVVSERDVPGASYGLFEAPLHWLRVGKPSECLEIQASPDTRRHMAEELGVSDAANLRDLHGLQDPVIWGLCARLRSLIRQSALEPGEADMLVRLAYARVLTLHFGGQYKQRGARLDNRRINRVVDYVEAHLENDLQIDRLADVAALSPFHFIRCFRLTFGVTPYHYIRMRRMERAAALMRRGSTVREAASGAGYANLNHFRAAARSHFGVARLADLVRGTALSGSEHT